MTLALLLWQVGVPAACFQGRFAAWNAYNVFNTLEFPGLYGELTP